MAGNEKVLIVEDDTRLAGLIGELLEKNGYDASTEDNGKTAIDRILAERPDLVILDINLPGRDGFTVCRKVRPEFRGRILVLTARGEEVDELIGLEAGADDYLAKPVAPKRLLARVRALLRRVELPGEIGDNTEKPIINGRLVIDPARRAAELDGIPIVLTTAEFELLWLLGRNIGRPLDRDAIFKELKGREYDGADRSIDYRISKLRRCLGDDPANPTWIKTVRGSGYIMARDG